MAKLPSDSIDAVPEEVRHPGTTTEAFAPAAAPRMMQVPLVLKLAAGFVIVAGIYLASDALIPVVLALLFSFLLAPLVDRLRAWKVSRILAVMMAVGLATGVLLAVASFLSMQMYDLAGNLPTFQGNIEKKIESLRTTPDGTIDRLLKMVTRLNSKINGSEEDPATDPNPPQITVPKGDEKIAAVVVEAKKEPNVSPLDLAGRVLNTTLGPLTTFGIVIIFVIFVLLEREEIRNRVIRMLGSRPGQLYASTQALDDAASRVSRYLQMQLIVNLTYGIPIGVGLYFIGVPNPILWGFLAVVLRFIPYVGPIIAAVCPMLLAFAVDPGWSMLIWTTLLYVVVEIISNNFIETWLYGTSTGISSVGILLSAVFWAWMWGPIGLLMSTPLTVCFVVLGKHIPAFSFFSLALGDQPVLPLPGRIYQRLLAMDPDEPDELIRQYLLKNTVADFFETVMLPLLRLVESERAHTVLDPIHQAFVIEQIRGMIEDVADHQDVAPDEKAKEELEVSKEAKAVVAPSQAATAGAAVAVAETGVSDAAASKEGTLPVRAGAMTDADSPTVICVPAHDVTDELAALMLTILLRRLGVATEVLSADMFASERLARLQAIAPPIVCISALPPFAAFHARHSVKRIRARLPGIRIVVGFWDDSIKPADLQRRLLTSGTDRIATSLKEATEELSRSDIHH